MSDAVLDFLSGGKAAPSQGQYVIPPQVQAQRDADAARIRTAEQKPDGGGMIATSDVVGTPKADPIMSFLESGGSAAPAASSKADRIPAPGVSAPHAPAVEQPSAMERHGLITPANNGVLDTYVRGPAEAAVSAVTGAAGQVIGSGYAAAKDLYKRVTGHPQPQGMAADEAADIARGLTYAPRTESGRAILETAGDVSDAAKLQGLNQPHIPGMISNASAAKAIPGGQTRIGAMLPGADAVRGNGVSLRSVADAAIPGRAASRGATAETAAYGSAGSAGATDVARARAMVSGASAELQKIVEDKIKKGEHINLEVLARNVEGDSLPVPVRLTRGQSTRDPKIYSDEQNERGVHERLSQRFNDQEKQLVANTQAIREVAAPDVYATDAPQHGDLIIDAYKAKDAKLNAGITEKYKALEDANGGDFPLDAKAFANSADSALHKQLLFDHVPAEYRSLLNRLREGGTMTFENFEALRTNLARTMRSAADGNARAAAGVIRDSLEALPMPKGAENLKPLADAARAAARERFSLIEKDPAYKAVTRGTASADKFVDKFVLNGDTKALETLKANLADDPVAHQAVASAVIKHLEKAAGADRGSFNQAGYNKALEKLRPKLAVLFDAETRAHLEHLGRVAANVSKQEKGMFVNNSNTLVAGLAAGAKAIGEHALNAKTAGMGGTLLHQIGKMTGAEGRAVKRTFDTSAALGYRRK